MDERDRQLRDAALAASLEASRDDGVREWHNPATGNSGAIEPLAGYANTADGAQVCREFAETYTRKGQTRTEMMRACRDADGRWRTALM
jgi:surface antigen